jgi:glycosyltransferase involved in cell wall biosynthesis
MKILQVNQFYYPRGGADKYFLDLTKTLTEAGHQVAVFSMAHPKNWPSPWSSYFVSRVSFNEGNLVDKLKTPGRVLYSREAKMKFARLVRDFQPEIIHLHNIYHHISPSILTVAKEYKIPVVLHLQDYKLICANHSLFTKGAICERCRPDKYYECLKNKCIKNSWAGSALAVAEMYLHHSILKIYGKNVDWYIAPSQFMKDKVVSFGHPAENISVIFNPYNAEISTATFPEENQPDAPYLLYFGRLSLEKGLETFIRAAAQSGQKAKIVGEGGEEASLRKLADQLKAPVEFIGFKNNQELRPIIQGAKAVVIPSIWDENMPLSLMEAWSLGKVVIASRIGGLPEAIQDNKNGLLFNPGDAADLTRKIRQLDKIDCLAISRAAKKTVADFSPEKNLQQVLAVYQRLLK